MVERFKNYGLWVSIFAFIPLVLEGFGVKILPENYNEIINSLLGILVLAGILSNPNTNNKGYLDDKTENSSNENEKNK
ncbi:holin [Haloimpatiens sp. FM7315]|uniref:holin n=1 Tax=Haloimpatiens sp. FM7315 TaxID=3298609 RepID=UPI0035A263B6